MFDEPKWPLVWPSCWGCWGLSGLLVKGKEKLNRVGATRSCTTRWRKKDIRKKGSMLTITLNINMQKKAGSEAAMTTKPQLTLHFPKITSGVTNKQTWIGVLFFQTFHFTFEMKSYFHHDFINFLHPLFIFSFLFIAALLKTTLHSSIHPPPHLLPPWQTMMFRLIHPSFFKCCHYRYQMHLWLFRPIDWHNQYIILGKFETLH